MIEIHKIKMKILPYKINNSIFVFLDTKLQKQAIYVPAQDLPFELFLLFLDSSGPCSGMLLSWTSLDNHLQASLCVILLLSLLYLGLRPAL